MSIKVLKSLAAGSALAALLGFAGSAGAAPFVSSPGGQVGQTLHVLVGDTQPADGYDAVNGFYLLDFQVSFDPAVIDFVVNSEVALPSGGLSASDYAIGVTLTGPGQLHGAVTIFGVPAAGAFAQLDFVALATAPGGTGGSGLVIAPTAGTTNYGTTEVVNPPDWSASAGAITAVPEPSAWLMALLGAATLPVFARRQRSRR